MMRKLLILAFTFSVLPFSLFGGGLTVRELTVTPAAHPDGPPMIHAAVRASANGLPQTAAAPAHSFQAFPVAGIVGQDLYIPYYVDLDPTFASHDWNCGRLTFDAHTGVDPYIRSFAEQAIGVPVFAAADGVVAAAHGGEPDQNTAINALAAGNSIMLSHGGGLATRYDHLRKDLLVSVGQIVSAGEQIGWVGSSGVSDAPHLHFEASVDSVPFEPFAGSCRAGASSWQSQPAIAFDRPTVLGLSLSAQPFNSNPPVDTTPHTGTFLVGAQSMYLQADLGGVGNSSSYTITLQRPNGFQSSATGTLTKYLADMMTARWAIDTNLDALGDWLLMLDVNGRRVGSVPFTVAAPGAITNRSPNALTVSLDATGSGEVPVCRAGSGFVADPDFDTVRYRYEWTVNGALARSVTSAARSDMLPRRFAAPGTSISCKVTASDGRLESVASTAYATVAGDGRRRVVGR